MIVFRFMGKEEFEKYKNGQVLHNEIKHKAKTNSIGFCFLRVKDFSPEEAMHFLNGIVSFDICAVFETREKLQKTFGQYARPIKNMEDAINAIIWFPRSSFVADEYCTTEYDNKKMKLLRYSKNIMKQYKTSVEQQTLDCIEV